MCNKGSAVGAEITAITLLVAGAFLSIGAMAGPFASISVPASSVAACKAFTPISMSFHAAALDSTFAAASAHTMYSAGCSATDSASLGSAYCAALGVAATNGGAAISLWCTALVLSLLAATFISMRVTRLRQNFARSTDAPAPAAKGCHTRAATTVVLSVSAFVLNLIAGIAAWVGVLPLYAWFYLTYIPTRLLSANSCLVLPSASTGVGSTLAGVVIGTSFVRQARAQGSLFFCIYLTHFRPSHF